MRYLNRTVLGVAVLAAAAITWAVAAAAATPGCAVIPNGACSSWQTPAGGGLDLDAIGQRGPALIVYTVSTTDPAEDFSTEPVPVGSVSIYAYAGSQTGTTAALDNNEYTPRGIPSGLCVSDVVAAAGQADELRPCNTVSGRYNPYQSFQQVPTGVGDGTFFAFEDSPVDAEGAATGLYLTDPFPQAGIGRKGHRVPVVSQAGAPGAFSEGQLWQAAA